MHDVGRRKAGAAALHCVRHVNRPAPPQEIVLEAFAPVRRGFPANAGQPAPMPHHQRRHPTLPGWDHVLRIHAARHVGAVRIDPRRHATWAEHDVARRLAAQLDQAPAHVKASPGRQGQLPVCRRGLPAYAQARHRRHTHLRQVPAKHHILPQLPGAEPPWSMPAPSGTRPAARLPPRSGPRWRRRVRRPHPAGGPPRRDRPTTAAFRRRSAPASPRAARPTPP